MGGRVKGGVGTGGGVIGVEVEERRRRRRRHWDSVSSRSQFFIPWRDGRANNGEGTRTPNEAVAVGRVRGVVGGDGRV